MHTRQIHSLPLSIYVVESMSRCGTLSLCRAFVLPCVVQVRRHPRVPKQEPQSGQQPIHSMPRSRFGWWAILQSSMSKIYGVCCRFLERQRPTYLSKTVAASVSTMSHHTAERRLRPKKMSSLYNSMVSYQQAQRPEGINLHAL